MANEKDGKTMKDAHERMMKVFDRYRRVGPVVGEPYPTAITKIADLIDFLDNKLQETEEKYNQELWKNG
jgi:hypothetical protein